MFIGVYPIRFPHGTLCIFGDNVESYIQQINKINTLKDLCNYCSIHNLRIYYNMDDLIPKCIIEWFRVSRFTKKYSIYSTQMEFKKFLKPQIKRNKEIDKHRKV